MKIRFVCMRVKKIIFMFSSHLASLWNRGLEQRNSEIAHSRYTNKKQGAHIHHLTAWPVPQACTPPYPRVVAAMYSCFSMPRIDSGNDLIFHLILSILSFLSLTTQSENNEDLPCSKKPWLREYGGSGGWWPHERREGTAWKKRTAGSHPLIGQNTDYNSTN